MLRMTPALLCSALALATLSSAACSKSSDATASSTSQSTVDVVVDETGFVPAVIKASVNQPLTLKITRKTDRTCATEIVIKSAGINQPLPLNQTVPVTVTPKEKGDLHFACAMDHIGGKLVVQ